jgi:hypothetical protein
MTKKITKFTAICADGEWKKYMQYMDPKPWEFCPSDSKDQIAKWIREDKAELDSFVEALPVNSCQWQKTYKGKRYDGGAILLTQCLYDFGAGVLAQFIVGEELQHLTVLLPGYRRKLFGDSTLELLSRILPIEISGRVVEEINLQVPAHKGNLMFDIMPRVAVKPETAPTSYPHLFLLRAGLRWAEKRDKAKRSRFKRRVNPTESADLAHATVFEAIYADGEWEEYLQEVGPNLVSDGESLEIDQANDEYFRELTEVVDLCLEKMELVSGTGVTGWDRKAADGEMIPVTLLLSDFGPCVVGQIILREARHLLMVIVPVHRRGLMSSEVLEGLRKALPAEISERVVQKMRQELSLHPGHLVFQIMPRSVLKPEPIDTYPEIVLLMLAGLAWAEKQGVPTPMQ